MRLAPRQVRRLLAGVADGDGRDDVEGHARAGEAAHEGLPADEEVRHRGIGEGV